MDLRISVVIPTLDRANDLRLTLDSYAAGTVLPDQVVIVDQSRRDPASIRQLAESYSDRFQTTYLYQETPSLTAARNYGLAHAVHDVIVMSDDDVTLEKDVLQNVRTLMRDPKLAMIAGLDQNSGPGKSLLGYAFCKKSWRNREIGHVTKSMLGRFPAKEVRGEVPTQWAMGFFFVIRRRLTMDWGLCWDEALTSYAYPEDLDFSYSYFKRASAASLACVMSDRVRVLHRVSPAARTPSRKATMMYVLNRAYLSYKHFPGEPAARLALAWSLVGDGLLRLRTPAALKDLLAAERICLAHRKELRAGVLRPEWYQA